MPEGECEVSCDIVVGPDNVLAANPEGLRGSGVGRRHWELAGEDDIKTSKQDDVRLRSMHIIRIL